MPLCQKCLKVAGFANLYPTKIKTAAKVASGIKFNKKGIVKTLINNKNMVAYNSKYIYPFGGSAEVPEEDPDKQIGEYIICSISMCIFIRSNTIQ